MEKFVTVHTLNGERRFRGKLADIEEKLEDNFLKCHKSCIINMDLVEEIYGSTICFENGKRC